MEILKVETNTGKEGIIIERYMYRKYRENTRENIWQWTKKSCGVVVKTNKLDSIILDVNSRHNHDEMSAKEVALKQLRQGCRKRVI